MRSFPEGDNPIICAGDIVGYGADPNPCIKQVRALGAVTVLGNHDAAVIDKTDITYFNEYAAEAVLWTRERLNRSGADYLNALPFVHDEKLFTMVHGTLHDPEEFLYMFSGADAMATFDVLKKQICFVGHSHVPCVFILKGGKLYLERSLSKKIRVEEDARYVINVGSVGQPRDGDSRACYCVYDTDNAEIEFRRIEYDVEGARDRIIKAGLPAVLGDRLLYGQ